MDNQEALLGASFLVPQFAHLQTELTQEIHSCKTTTGEWFKTLPVLQQYLNMKLTEEVIKWNLKNLWSTAKLSGSIFLGYLDFR